MLYADVDRIDFRTRVDWHETMRVLKVAFRPALHTRAVTAEIPVGASERPTHRNTAYDAMRFEHLMHKWVDLSESDFGLSILNDSKYGYDAYDDTLRLTLLRAPMEPDVTADRGSHVFTYSLYPHGGRWNEKTVHAALELNEAPVFLKAGKKKPLLPAASSFVTLSDERVAADTIKQAQDGDGFILRLYETTGGSGTETVRFCREVRSAESCDLMEENGTPVTLTDGALTFSFKPYEILTFRLRF